MKKLYKDRDWLYKIYIIKKLSTYQIAEEIKMNKETIREWLKKFSIPIRSREEGIHLAKANHCNLSQEAKEWIDGELLGDGCLHSQSSYSASFSYHSKYFMYVQYVSDTLASFGIEQMGKIREEYTKNFNCYVYRYASRNYVEFLPIKKHWYPKGKKIVPRETELTSLTCRQWYIGDGCLEQVKNRKPYIFLYTNAFLVSDVEWLITKLDKLGFKATRQPSNNTIRISSYSTKEFLNYIGECPVECYKYKWNYL